MDSERLRQWVKLDKYKKGLQAELSEIETQMLDLEGTLIDQMADAGIESIKIDQRNIYINTRIWAKYGTKDKAIKALKAAGLHDFLSENFNHVSLSAFISECVKENKPLPEAFQGVIEPIEKHRLKVRKS